MKNMKKLFSGRLCLAVALACQAMIAQAQTTQVAMNPEPRDGCVLPTDVCLMGPRGEQDSLPSVTSGLAYSYASVTNNYGNWSSIDFSTTVQGKNDTVLIGLSDVRRFKEQTGFGSLTYIRQLNDDWFGSVGVSGSNNGTILPSTRVDASISRKLLNDRSLILTLGAGYAWNRSGHQDQIYDAGFTWYAAPRWVFQGGVTYNIDTPGSITAPRGYGVVTWGEQGRDVVTAAVRAGKEAYQTIGNASQLVDFSSQEVGIGWRHWFNKELSMNVGATYYHNPSYTRFGGQIGLFYQWK